MKDQNQWALQHPRGSWLWCVFMVLFLCVVVSFPSRSKSTNSWKRKATKSSLASFQFSSYYLIENWDNIEIKHSFSSSRYFISIYYDCHSAADENGFVISYSSYTSLDKISLLVTISSDCFQLVFFCGNYL